jgi:hypothetical protein
MEDQAAPAQRRFDQQPEIIRRPVEQERQSGQRFDAENTFNSDGGRPSDTVPVGSCACAVISALA